MDRYFLAMILIAISAAMPRVIAQGPVSPDASKTARVTGVVVDAMDDHPLRRAIVCFRTGGDSGSYNLRGEHCDESDEQGRFSLSGLVPARYTIGLERIGYIAAEPGANDVPSVIELQAGEDLRGVRLRMQRTGSIRGRVVFGDGEPFPGGDLELKGPSGDHHEKSSEAGEYRFRDLIPGDYRVVVNPPNAANCDSSSGHRQRLYVERGSGSDTPIHVESGQEANGPDIVMIEATPHRIGGRVISDEFPLPRGWRVSIGKAVIPASSLDGSFASCGVVPGEYIVRADGQINGRMRVGEVKIHVEDEDVTNVEITPEMSAFIRARIEVEDSFPLDLSLAHVVTIADSFPYDSYPQPHREADGTFQIGEIYTGEYRFALFPLPTGSYLKSANVRGQDVIETPILIHGGENLDSLVFTVSAKAAAVSGVVQDQSGSKLTDAMVMLEPDPRHGDRDIHTCTRTTDQHGGFGCENLAPGKYRIAAWRSVSDMEKAWNQRGSSGIAVELSEGRRVPIVLTIASPSSN